MPSVPFVQLRWKKNRKNFPCGGWKMIKVLQSRYLLDPEKHSPFEENRWSEWEDIPTVKEDEDTSN